MPDQPSPDKQMISVRVSRELYRKAKILSEKHGFTLSDTLVMIIEYATRKINLTSEDYEKIARETAQARIKRSSSAHSRGTTSEGENKVRGKGQSSNDD